MEVTFHLCVFDISKRKMLLILPVRQLSIENGSSPGRISTAHRIHNFLEKILTKLAEWQNIKFFIRAINELKLCMLSCVQCHGICAGIRALLLWKIPVGAVVLDPKWPQKQPGGVTKMGIFWGFGTLRQWQKVKA